MAKRNFGDEFGFQTRAVHTGNDVDSETGEIGRASCRERVSSPV